MRVGSLPRGPLPPSCGARLTPLVSVSPKLTWCPEPYLKSRKAEKAAAIRNSDFAGCPGNPAGRVGGVTGAGVCSGRASSGLGMALEQNPITLHRSLRRRRGFEFPAG